MWDKEDKLSEMKSILEEVGLFDLIIGPDILFFEEYHMDLLQVLKSCLSNETGRILLLQPHRGGSMDRFMKKAENIFPPHQNFIKRIYEDEDLSDIVVNAKKKINDEKEQDTLIPSLVTITASDP